MKRLPQLCLTMLLLCNVVEAIPPQITISGLLRVDDQSTTDATTGTLSGDFGFEVIFYSSETTSTVVGSPTTGTVAVTEGVFSIRLTPPQEIINLTEVWYSLAIDTDRNGLDAQDLFEDRFQITSVPYTLTGPPTSFFVCHNGWSGGGVGVGSNPATRLNVSPFMTPAGGVRFNKMSMTLRTGLTGIISFGIYDSSGQVVAVSGPINLASYPAWRRIIEVEASGFLQPARLYYTGWTASTDTLTIDVAPNPPVRGYGIVTIPNSNGMVPNSFNPDHIQETDWTLTMPVGLIRE